MGVDLPNAMTKPRMKSTPPWISSPVESSFIGLCLCICKREFLDESVVDAVMKDSNLRHPRASRQVKE